MSEKRAESFVKSSTTQPRIVAFCWSEYIIGPRMPRNG